MCDNTNCANLGNGTQSECWNETRSNTVNITKCCCVGGQEHELCSSENVLYIPPPTTSTTTTTIAPTTKTTTTVHPSATGTPSKNAGETVTATTNSTDNNEPKGCNANSNGGLASTGMYLPYSRKHSEKCHLVALQNRPVALVQLHGSCWSS